jgi:uncharacterized protein (UPF0332 family)
MDVAQDSLGGAGECLRGERYRSAVSRSYYAMYAAVTAALKAAGLKPATGRETWSHRSVADLVKVHLRQVLGQGGIQDVCRMVRATYKLRLIADYSAARTIDEVTARRCVTDATAVIRKLESY